MKIPIEIRKEDTRQPFRCERTGQRYYRRDPAVKTIKALQRYRQADLQWLDRALEMTPFDRTTFLMALLRWALENGEIVSPFGRTVLSDYKEGFTLADFSEPP